MSVTVPNEELFISSFAEEAEVVQVKDFSLKVKNSFYFFVNTLLSTRNVTAMVAGPSLKSTILPVVLVGYCYTRLLRKEHTSVDTRFLCKLADGKVEARLFQHEK